MLLNCTFLICALAFYLFTFAKTSNVYFHHEIKIPTALEHYVFMQDINIVVEFAALCSMIIMVVYQVYWLYFRLPELTQLI